MLINFIFTNILYIFLININYGHSINVSTTSGVVRGQAINVLNTSIYEFLGIPYAEPPVGDLRFAKPVPIEKPLNVSLTNIYKIFM